jgi:hypothetical protein
MFGATMPEASVDKDGDALMWEDEVWAAWQRMMAPPALDSGVPKNRGEFELGISVPL